MGINSNFGLSKKVLNSRRTKKRKIGFGNNRSFLKPMLVLIIIGSLALLLRLLTIEKGIYAIVEGLIDDGQYEKVLVLSGRIEKENKFDIRLHKLMAKNAYYLARKNDDRHNDKTEIGWKYYKRAIVHIKKAILLAGSNENQLKGFIIDAVDYYILGFSYMHLGDDKYKEAIKYLLIAGVKNLKDKTLESNRSEFFNYDNLLRMLGYLHYKVGNYKKAIEYYQSANQRKKVVLNYLYMGLCYKFVKQYDKAITSFITVNKYTDNSDIKMSGLHNLGWIYFHQGKVKEAKKIYLRSVSLDTNFSEGFYWLGNMEENEGDLKGAKALWRRSLVADPNFGPSILKMRFYKNKKR